MMIVVMLMLVMTMMMLFTHIKKDVKIHPERRLLRLGLPADNLLIVLLLPPFYAIIHSRL